jgi:hypothetical protein
MLVAVLAGVVLGLVIPRMSGAATAAGLELSSALLAGRFVRPAGHVVPGEFTRSG